MDKLRVLFVCSQNAGRSQMAEAFLRRFAGDTFEVESAGLNPAERVHPLVQQVMGEVGIDLSGKKPQNVFDLFRQGRLYDYVIAVCGQDAADSCPVFPGITHRWHWPFPDPAAVGGSPEEQLAQVRVIRDLIRSQVERPFETESER